MENVLYALVIWGLNSTPPVCSVGWNTVEQCEAAVGMSLSHGRKDLSWNCVPYPVFEEFQCSSGGR